MKKFEKYECQRCGEPIGYVGRFVEWLLGTAHNCEPNAPKHYTEEIPTTLIVRIPNNGPKMVCQKHGMQAFVNISKYDVMCRVCYGDGLINSSIMVVYE